MPRSFWLSWLLLTSVSALPWAGPQETFSATATADWTPAPTNGVRELFKRGSYPANLCGWQGAGYQGAYCSSDSSCAWFTDYSVVGCCSIGGYCDAVYTSCIDGDHPLQSVSYPGVYTCKSTDVCYRNTFPSGYYQYGCGSTSIGETVVTSWTGINTQLSIPIVYTGGVLETEAPVTLISTTAVATSSKTAASLSAAMSSSAATSSKTAASLSAATTSFAATSSQTAASSSAATSSRTAASSSVPESSAAPKSSSAPASSSASASSAKSSTTVISFAESSFTISSTISSFSNAPSAILGSPASKNPSKGLSTGGKIAIGVVAAVIAIVAVALIIFCCFFRHPKQGKDLHPFPNSPADGGVQTVPPHEQLQGSKNNPAELYQSYHPLTRDAQYTPFMARAELQGLENRGDTYSPAPSYETRIQTPLQSPPNTATLSAVSARSSAMSPILTMNHLPDVYELPTNRSARPAIAAAALPDLDNSNPRNTGMLSSYSRSSIQTAEENLARVTREMEHVRAEQDMAIRLRQLERREKDLKEQILREQRSTME